MQKSIIIIGAGLSGLYTAYLLQERYNVTLIEARERIGGRIYTKNGLDMGPSWIWDYNTKILELLQKFSLEKFEHYEMGDALYDIPPQVQRFQTPSQRKSYHLKGGMVRLVEEIFKSLKNVTYHSQETVLALKEMEDKVIVKTTNNSYESDYVISTLPPRVTVSTLKFTPELESLKRKHMFDTSTWMGYVQKVVIKYDKPFWREGNLSGFVYAPHGPLNELHDISEENNGILFGFAQAKTEITLEAIESQLQRVFGKEGLAYKDIEIVNWGDEKFTSVAKDKEGLLREPMYGFDFTHFNGKVHFIGTETDVDSGGYLEGAINSALRVNTKFA